MEVKVRTKAAGRCVCGQAVTCAVLAAAVAGMLGTCAHAAEEQQQRGTGSKDVRKESLVLDFGEFPHSKIEGLLYQQENEVDIQTLKVCLQRLDNHVATERDFHHARDIELTDDVLIAIGNRYVRSGNYDLARRAFGDVIERFPSHVRTFNVRGTVLLSSPDPGDDPSDLRETRFGSYSWYHRNSSARSAAVRIAQSYICEGKLDEAGRVLEELVAKVENEEKWSEDDLPERIRGELTERLLRNRPDKVALHHLLLVAVKRGDAALATRATGLLEERFPKSCAELVARLKALSPGDEEAIHRELARIYLCPPRERWYRPARPIGPSPFGEGPEGPSEDLLYGKGHSRITLASKPEAGRAPEEELSGQDPLTRIGPVQGGRREPEEKGTLSAEAGAEHDARSGAPEWLPLTIGLAAGACVTAVLVLLLLRLRKQR